MTTETADRPPRLKDVHAEDAERLRQRGLKARRLAEAEVAKKAAKAEERRVKAEVKKRAVQELKRIAEFPSQATPEEIRSAVTLALVVLNPPRREVEGQTSIDDG